MRSLHLEALGRVSFVLLYLFKAELLDSTVQHSLGFQSREDALKGNLFPEIQPEITCRLHSGYFCRLSLMSDLDWFCHSGSMPKMDQEDFNRQVRLMRSDPSDNRGRSSLEKKSAMKQKKRRSKLLQTLLRRKKSPMPRIIHHLSTVFLLQLNASLMRFGN